VTASFSDSHTEAFSCTHEAVWTPLQTHYSEDLVAPGIEPGTSGSVARNSDHWSRERSNRRETVPLNIRLLRKRRTLQSTSQRDERPLHDIALWQCRHEASHAPPPNPGRVSAQRPLGLEHCQLQAVPWQQDALEAPFQHKGSRHPRGVFVTPTNSSVSSTGEAWTADNHAEPSSRRTNRRAFFNTWDTRAADMHVESS
jgi:hypothetical protein